VAPTMRWCSDSVVTAWAMEVVLIVAVMPRAGGDVLNGDRPLADGTTVIHLRYAYESKRRR